VKGVVFIRLAGRDFDLKTANELFPFKPCRSNFFKRQIEMSSQCRDSVSSVFILSAPFNPRSAETCVFVYMWLLQFATIVHLDKQVIFTVFV